jgi:hypothetical protein
MRLTILFDSPYWIGLLELERDGLLYAAKYIFGAEPSDTEVFEFVQCDLLNLQARMTVGLPIDDRQADHPVNPKRIQREVRRTLAEQGITSKAHEAMRLQLESVKQFRATISKEQREAERAYKREVAQSKAKARHRGR